MNLTTKGKFAVIALIDVALYDQGKAINLATISKRQSISLSYLEQLFTKLRKAGLVNSIRGPGGGYVLGKAPKDININEIISAVENSLDATSCSGSTNCQGGNKCIAHNIWQNLNKTIANYLSTITIDDVINDLKNNTNKLKRTH